MRMILPIIFTALLIMPYFSSAVTQANRSYIPIFSIDERIIQLLAKSEKENTNKKLLLKNVQSLFASANPAEQYLLYSIQANLSSGFLKHQNIITILDEVKNFGNKMNQEQLDSPPFINVFKKRAESYAFLGKFKEAYKEKQQFIEKYNNFLLTDKKKYTFELEAKYETKKKRDTNQLLSDQTVLKDLEINHSLGNEVIQQRNIYILSALGFIFIVLLVRSIVINKRTHNLSQQDMLTGLFNRKALFSYGEKITIDCLHHNEKLCLLAIHIDHFKKINHQYGDYIGDEVLKKLALIGKESMRNRDVFARLDDATFIALLPESTVGEIKAIAQHIKGKFTSTNFHYIGIPQYLDLSLGIVELNQTYESFESLLNVGMDVLYELKDDNGGKISIYKDD